MSCMSRHTGRVREFPVAVFESLLRDPVFASFSDRPAGPNLPVDVAESETHVIVRAALPGFSAAEVEAQVHEGVLTLAARRTETPAPEGEKVLHRELSRASLSRSIQLPCPVVEDQAQAELKDGVLTLRLPKVQKEQPRRIPIA